MEDLGFDLDDARLARMAWSTLAEPADKEAQRLVATLGPVTALRTVLDGGGEARWRVRTTQVQPLRDLATLTRLGGRVLIPDDPEWPLGLLALGAEAPYCLYVRGPLDLAEAWTRSAAIVGSRAATGYGEHVAADLGSGCALRGITVVSGAAYGIDGAAHRGALSVEGATIAILACGADRYYPRGHEDLIRRVAETGAVVSEVPPGCAPTRWRFVERNRVIAALARVTVVVEAGHRSGARGTAWRALRMGLPVAAVPGPVTSPMSYGCHRLLREEGVTCVTDAEEVAELACPIGEQYAEPPPVPAREVDALGLTERRTLDALPARTPAALPSIARAAGLLPGDVAGALVALESRGLALRRADTWRRP